MKICLFGDVHWSKSASIVNKAGKKYSIRLEMLINSMNWVNELAAKNNCETMICVGDFFDKPALTDEEITAIKEINWTGLHTYFLVGNHESSVASLKYNSVKLLESAHHAIISEPVSFPLDKINFHFVPYIAESNRKDLKNYLPKINNKEKNVIISHNDIKGISFGAIESKVGFTIPEIEEACDLYINGHLHNSAKITDKIVNLGSLSAHNFTNDSLKYSYGAWILDTDTLNLTFFENPYAFNFYKLEIGNKADLSVLDKLKNNAVLSIKCNEKLVPELKEKLDKLKNIVETRLIIVHDIIDGTTTLDSASLKVDYKAKLKECAYANLERTKILEEELAEICK